MDIHKKGEIIYTMKNKTEQILKVNINYHEGQFAYVSIANNSSKYIEINVDRRILCVDLTVNGCDNLTHLSANKDILCDNTQIRNCTNLKSIKNITAKPKGSVLLSNSNVNLKDIEQWSLWKNTEYKDISLINLPNINQLPNYIQKCQTLYIYGCRYIKHLGNCKSITKEITLVETAITNLDIIETPTVGCTLLNNNYLRNVDQIIKDDEVNKNLRIRIEEKNTINGKIFRYYNNAKDLKTKIEALKSLPTHEALNQKLVWSPNMLFSKIIDNTISPHI